MNWYLAALFSIIAAVRAAMFFNNESAGWFVLSFCWVIICLTTHLANIIKENKSPD